MILSAGTGMHKIGLLDECLFASYGHINASAQQARSESLSKSCRCDGIAQRTATTSRPLYFFSLLFSQTAAQAALAMRLLMEGGCGGADAWHPVGIQRYLSVTQA